MNDLKAIQCESCGEFKPENVCEIAHDNHRKRVIKMCFCGVCHTKYNQSGIEVANFTNLKHLNRNAYAFRIRKLKEDIRERLG